MEMQAWMIKTIDNLSTHNTNGVCTDKSINFFAALDRTGSGLCSLMGCIVNVA
jgi:glutamate dehydrogenase/leucine dehydrogenase